MPDNRVKLVAPDGEVGLVPQDRAQEFLAAGFREQTAKEELGEKVSAAETGVLGAVKGLTFGFGLKGLDYLYKQIPEGIDPAGEFIPGKYSDLEGPAPEGPLRRYEAGKEANPVAAVAGEVVGGVAGLGFTGLSGLAAKGGEFVARKAIGKTAETLIGKVASSALTHGVSGAIEGGIVGAGNLVTEEALGNAEYNAEAILNHVGLPAVFGGAAGGITGAGAEFLKGGSAALRRAVGDKLKSRAAKSVEEVAETADELDTLVAQDIADSVKPGPREKALPKGGALDRAADSAAQESLGLTGAKWASLTRRLGAGRVARAVRKIRKLEVELPDGTRSKLISAGDSADEIAPKLKLAVDRARKTVDETAKGLDALQPAGSIDATAVADEIESFVREKFSTLSTEANKNAADNLIKNAADIRSRGKITFDELRDLRREYGSAWRTTQANESVKKIGEKKIERILKEASDTAMDGFADDALGPGWKALQREANNDLSLLLDISQASQDKAIRSASNAYFGITDTMAGIGMAAGRLAGGESLLEAGVKGAATAWTIKQVKGRGASLAARVFDSASGSRFLNEAAERIASFSTIEKAVGTTSQAVDSAVDALISGVGKARVGAAVAGPQILNSISFGPNPERTKSPQESAKRISDELAKLSEDPRLLAEHVSNTLAQYGNIAPAHAQAVTWKASQVAGFLNERAPKRPTSSSSFLTPQVDNWKPTKSEAAKFARYVSAAVSPEGVVKQLAKGDITLEGSEVLRELYPELLDRVRSRIAARSAARKKQLPYRDRVNLSILLGVPLDPTMEPAFIGSVQSQNQSAPNQGHGGGGTRLTALKGLEPARGISPRSSEIVEEGV